MIETDLHEPMRLTDHVMHTAVLRRIVRTVATLLVCATWSSAASASCVWTDLVRSSTQAATVNRTAPRVHFVRGEDHDPACPGAGRICQSPAYVMAGDVVLAGTVSKGYTCAGFQGAKGSGTIGWLPTAALTLLSPAGQAPTDWTGRWSAPEQDITIRAVGSGMLSVKGDATWGMSAWRAEHGSVHTGTLNGVTRPRGGILSFTEGEERTLSYAEGDKFSCKVRMIRRGPYLLVRDNNNCGGANVSFSGFYARKR